ncbi:MAG TPA: bifunctional 3,4-dihydroxy-2-butanone-4-phosphate synthase/GTP cyclohydrolase II [Steroidobacteraceae bacterium]|nr:bifunctional 3,4-dihydroxy-2-butanone-4-phosphate synthase/GTP cyclohydrolase II [Steroidobacteraceae bacterium]HQX47216.1 bifunctional 3,4-dihydroxy-2-butanone-4-phosphate synthase/GTP cyclohydrolase II [Steroidobacteraceae bacterium]HQX77445.1 bifunctional 3,4-dihydroxy-2-butanone-4-phosphate synthase/GTP cyclohydrolase II [Steroidobacteraceae bacterium]
MELHSIAEILTDLRAGRMVLVMDDEDRENEGDLVMVAEKVRPEDVNFMARFGRGLICLTLTAERCRQLRLPLMVSSTQRDHRTNFTLSIEAAEGVTTGISAYDRAHTVLTAVKPEARPEDLRQPGHIFPIMAQPGGVLTRAGHTEAGCDLARLAGFEAAAVIVEVMNDDGTMARRPQLEAFARHHGLKIGTIADLIRYRLRNERSVERIAERTIGTEYGEFRLHAYEDHVQRDVHLALVRGDVTSKRVPLVRVHLADTLRDVLGAEVGAPRAWTLRAALARIAKEDCGVVVVLRRHETPRELIAAIRDEETPPPPAQGEVLRTFGVGAQILKDLGVRRMQVLSAPKYMHGISAFDLEIEGYLDNDD